MPDPLHPAIVHLPIALAMLVPLFAGLGLVVIQRGWLPVRVWAVVVLLQVLLVGSAFVALETGEDQEERVERFVAEDPIESHEDAAKRFLAVAGVGLVAVAAGLLPERRGAGGRIVGTIASLGVLAAAVAVGHSGGELVYRHGAANAYVSDAASANSAHRLQSHHD